MQHSDPNQVTPIKEWGPAEVVVRPHELGSLYEHTPLTATNHDFSGVFFYEFSGVFFVVEDLVISTGSGSISEVVVSSYSQPTAGGWPSLQPKTLMGSSLRVTLLPIASMVAAGSTAGLVHNVRGRGHQVSKVEVDIVPVQRPRRFEQIAAWYTLSDGQLVRRFLHNYPVLIDVLTAGYPRLQECFGLKPQVVLRVITDPETKGPEKLFAYIVTSLSPMEAMERLNKLDDMWFLEQLDRVAGLFNFNLEFV